MMYVRKIKEYVTAFDIQIIINFDIQINFMLFQNAFLMYI